MPVEQAAEFVLQACEAIAEAHALGIVHRDLKPANLFCIRRADGLLSVKVLDFGISKIDSRTATRMADMTRTAAVVGSPFYMSPEQMQSSKGVDARTDIWSLGVILFELTTGRLPFESDTVTELAIKIATEPAPPVRSFRGDLPAGLERAIARCLEKDRGRRFQTVGELAIALAEYAPPRARASVERTLRTLGAAQAVTLLRAPSDPTGVSPSQGASSGTGPSGTVPAWGHTSSTKKSGGAVLIGSVAALALLAVVGAAVVVVAKRPASTPRVPTSASSENGSPAEAAAVLANSQQATEVVSATPQQAASASSPVEPLGSTASNAVAPPSASTVPSAIPSRHTTLPVPPPVPKANCSPPYVIDAAGHRKYKPECL
jgi:serine/threonine-protein kinase